MEQMLLVMTDRPSAAVAGLAGMVCYAISPLFRTRTAMLVVYSGNDFGFALHYALLGERTAVTMNGILAVQTILAIMLVRRQGLRWVYYAVMPVPALASVVTWQGIPSLLAGSATMLSLIGRMQTNDFALRVLLLASAPFWGVHDLIVGSLPGLAADVLSIAIGMTMLLQRTSSP